MQTVDSRLFLKVICLIAILLITGCTKKIDSLKEYENYFYSEKSGYAQKITKKGFKLKLQYLPTDMMLVNEYKYSIAEIDDALRDSTITREKYDERIADIKEEAVKSRINYDKSIFFKLTIGFENDDQDIVFTTMQGGRTPYYEWLNKLLFSMNQYVFLHTEKSGKVKLSLYNMDRNFGMAKSRTFLFSFPIEFNNVKLLDQNDITLYIKEFGLHTGTITFKNPVPHKKVILNYF